MNESSLLDNLSNHLKNVIAKSIALATGLDHEQVEPAHIFLALTEERGSMACEILQKNGIEEKKLLDALTEVVRIPAKKKKEKNGTATLPQLSNLSKQAMEKAMVLAYQESHNYVGTEHMLYGLLQIEDENINNVLQLLNVKKKDILKNVKTAIQSISNFPNMDEMPEMVEQIQKTGQNTPQKHTDDMLKKYTVELTDTETQKNIDPVIGREKEIERMIHILSRRNKNNPILLGESGVGKTAIVEGLAKKISEGDVPDILKNKHILNLDLTHLISGTIYRGEFEDRLKQVIDEVSKNPNTILFIDEIHNIIGAGSNQGTMDAANILKPALARGKIRCIGATTLDEYNKYISGDPALERRFQTIHVFEPSVEETKQILSGIKKFYENYHKTNITEEAIESAVELSTKYIHDNFLPDKAIDLIDEACALVRTKTKMSLEEQKQNELQEKQNKLERDMEETVIQEKFEETEKIQKEIDKIKKEQEQLSKTKEKNVKYPLVTKEDIVHVLSNRINIAKDVLLSDEMKRLGDAKIQIQKYILGQNSILQKIFERLEHQELGLSASNGPRASFFFAGPSGVGKTELAKHMAREILHDENSLIHINMAEFAEEHGVSKLLGSPAGYIGFKERNHFLDTLKRRPNSIVLFDEIDKAHPNVLKIIKQLLENGKLTTSSGKDISFHHAIVVLTANIPLEKYTTSNFGFEENLEEKNKKEIYPHVQEYIKTQYGPEILSRIDEVCTFSPLSKEIMKEIIALEAEHLTKRIQEKKTLKIQMDDMVINCILEDAFQADLGARNIAPALRHAFFEAIKNKKETTKKTFTLKKENQTYILF